MTSDEIQNTKSNISNNYYVLKLHIGIILTTLFQIFSIFRIDKDLSYYSIIISNLIIFSYFLFLYKFFFSNVKEFITTYILSLIFNFCLLKILISHDLFLIQIYIYLISLCIYHFCEYAFVCVFHPEKLGFNSK